MRTTITLDDTVYKTLKRHAARSDVSLSHFIQDAIINQVLEDLEDIEDALTRMDEPSIPFDDVVAELRAEGLLDQ